MEIQELVFSTINTLKHPIVLLEIKEEEYLISYFNESMKNILNLEESAEPKLPDDFLKMLVSYKDKINSNGLMINNIEFFNKFYNINIIENANHLLVTFIQISLDNLFDNLTFHDMGSACSAMIVVLDEKGELVDSNECFLSFVGMKKEDVLHKDFFESFIPGNKELLNQHLGKLLSSDSGNHHFITPLKNINEDVYRINWQVSKIVKQKQNFIIAVGSDISTLLEQNNNYKQELNSIKVGFEYFPFAVGYMNNKGIFTTINKKFIKMFHIKDENTKINFEQIPFFRDYIGFDKMLEDVKLIKEVNYKIKYPIKDTFINFNIDIRMLSGKQESSKLFIVVAQKVKS